MAVRVLPKVRSALCAASQLPGEGPTDKEDAPSPACQSQPDNDDDDDDDKHDQLPIYKYYGMPWHSKDI